MKETRCIFCDKNSNNTVIVDNGYKGKKCPTCGLIYISPRPLFSTIRKMYRYDRAQISAISHITNTILKRLIAKHHIRIIKEFIEKGSLLEIGSGAGYFLDEAKKEKFDVVHCHDYSALPIGIKLKKKKNCSWFMMPTKYGDIWLHQIYQKFYVIIF